MKYLLIKSSVLLLVLQLVIKVQAQENPCNMQWGPWQTVMTHSWGNVSISIQSARCNGSGICGWPKIALQHTFADQAAVDVTLGGIDCEGNEIKNSFSTGGNKISAYTAYKGMGNWHIFKQVQKVLRVEVTFYRGSDYYRILLDNEKHISHVYKNNRPL